MAAVANQNQQPLPPSSSARNSPVDYSRDASASDTSLPAPPPPPSNAPAHKGKAGKGKKAAANSGDPNDAHKALIAKISQLEASSTETAKEEG